MTSHISSPDSDSSYTYYPPPKKKKTEKETLIEELVSHFNHVSKYDDDKHRHKKNVLEVAIAFLEGTKSFEDLNQAIVDNPSYNQAVFSSETEKYVFKAISLPPREPNVSLSTEKMKLIIQLQHQLNDVSGKKDDKHLQKTAVLEIAIQLLYGKADKKDLETAIKNNPRYNEAIFMSKTEQLINKAIEQAPGPSLGLGK